MEQLCTEYPENKFLVTMLSRENQHELAIAAQYEIMSLVLVVLNNQSYERSQPCWRLLSFIPQHSD